MDHGYDAINMARRTTWRRRGSSTRSRREAFELRRERSKSPPADDAADGNGTERRPAPRAGAPILMPTPAASRRSTSVASRA